MIFEILDKKFINFLFSFVVKKNKIKDYFIYKAIFMINFIYTQSAIIECIMYNLLKACLCLCIYEVSKFKKGI